MVAKVIAHDVFGAVLSLTLPPFDHDEGSLEP